MDLGLVLRFTYVIHRICVIPEGHAGGIPRYIGGRRRYIQQNTGWNSIFTWTTSTLVQILCFWTLSILFFYIKNTVLFIFQNNVSETGVHLRLQVKPTQLGQIDRARAVFSDKNRMTDNVQKHNICTNVPLSQTLRSYELHYHLLGKKD
jgi:hypothetical protein